MTPQQLIEERKKYGIPEQGYGSQSSVSKSAIDNSIAELENAWTPKAEPSTISKVGESAKELFTPTVETGKGILKGAGSTIYGAGQLGEKILRGTVGKGVEAITGKPLGEQTYKEEKPKILQPEGGYQKLGYGAEKIAEFFIPTGKIGQVENIIKTTTKASLLSKLIPIVGEKTASFLAKSGEIGLRSLLRGVEAGGITAIQQGEVGKEAKIATGIGAAMPIVSEGVGLLKKALPSIFEFTSGVPKKAIEKRMIDIAENKAIAPTEQTVENIRTKAVKEYQNLSKELGDEFSQGLENISKNVPRIGQARTVAKEGTPGVFSGVKGQFKTLMENAKENVPKTLRDFRISVQKSGEILDFDKLNSAIVSPSEQRQIQKVWETLKNQSDFSVKGVQDTAARINALADFTEGAKTQTSAVVGKIHNVYDKAIKEVYPELGALRDKYAQTSKVLGEIGNVIGSKANKPTQIQQAVTRLSNLFKEDKETYINAIQELSKRSGVDFLNLLSSTEFQKVLPDFIRGFGGGATVSVAASLLNPWLIALAPLFSPRGVSTALKIGAKAPDISRVIEALPSALKNSGNE